jgi:hypothetical protein
MPRDSGQGRFLLRGSALLIVMLLLWWLVLLNPMLFLLRSFAEISWSVIFSGEKLISELPSGDWSLRVPVEGAIPGSPGHPGPTKIDSIEFDVARPDLMAFTFSLPVYWAIVLAAPGLRRSLRPLILGTTLAAVLEIILFLAFAEISAHHAAAQWSGRQSEVSKWFLSLGNYLVVNAVPYAAPFIIVLALHRELRWRIFQWGNSEPAGGREGLPKPSRKGRRRAIRPAPAGPVRGR